MTQEPTQEPTSLARPARPASLASSAGALQVAPQAGQQWEFADDWIAGQRSDHTKRAYAADWQAFVAYCQREHGLRHVREVRLKHLVAYRNARHAEGKSNATIARNLRAVKAALDYAVAAGYLADNPAKLVKTYRVSGHSPRHALSNREVQRLLEAVDRSDMTGQRDWAMLHLLLYLALRRSEVAALSCGDLAYEESQVVLHVHGKGDKDDTLPVPPRVAEAVRRYLIADGRASGPDDPAPWVGRPADEPLLRRVKNPAYGGDLEGHLSGQAVWKQVRSYARAAGLLPRGRMDVHTLRHTGISNALAHGAPVDRVRRMARHESAATTLRYATYQDNLTDSAVYKIEYGD